MHIGLVVIGKVFYAEGYETFSQDSDEHLGLGYLAAVLKKNGFNVAIVHMDTDNEIREYIKEKKPNIIGFSPTCFTMKKIMHLSKIIKEENKNIFVLYGGHMATFSADRVLDVCENVDFLLRGEGEYILLDMCKKLCSGESMEGVEGISYKKNKRNIHNKEKNLICNLDALPFPDRGQYEKSKSYSFLRICGSRGCFGNCGFCSSYIGRNQKPLWRGRSINNIVDEMEYLWKKYGIRTFDFVDSSFEDPPVEGKKRLWELAWELKKRGLKFFFSCNFRAEGWGDEDCLLIDMLEEVGLERVFIGIESGNDMTLRFFNKRASVQDNINVIKLFKDRKRINMTFGFIMFHPYASLEEISENANFLYETGICHDIRNYLTKLEVYPATAIKEKMQVDNLIQDKDDFSEVYEYGFINSEVGKFGRRVHELLQVNEIFEYINVDMRFYSLLSRIFRHEEEMENKLRRQVHEARNFLLDCRKDIAEFNYRLFVQLIEEYYGTGEINIKWAKFEIKKKLRENILMMRNTQVKFLHNFYLNTNLREWIN